jgi:hypothetical protein
MPDSALGVDRRLQKCWQVCKKQGVRKRYTLLAMQKNVLGRYGVVHQCSLL